MSSPREIYFSYGCSTFHMIREGVYDEYKRNGVTDEQEAQWRDEFRQILLKRLADDPCDEAAVSEYLSCVAKPEEKSIDALVSILEKQMKKMDAFSCLLCAECICDFLRHDGLSASIQRRLTNLGVALLDETLRNPNNIGSRYKSIGYLKEMLTKDKIESRATESLRKIKKLRIER